MPGSNVCRSIILRCRKSKIDPSTHAMSPEHNSANQPIRKRQNLSTSNEIAVLYAPESHPGDNSRAGKRDCNAERVYGWKNEPDRHGDDQIPQSPVLKYVQELSQHKNVNTIKVKSYIFAAVTCALRSCSISTKYEFAGLNKIETCEASL